VRRLWVGGPVAALLLAGSPAPGLAQVFLASDPHPEFAIAPLFVSGIVHPDLGPVNVRVSWSLTVPPDRPPARGEALYLLWPNEVAAATLPGPPEPSLTRHVEERGFTVVGGGRLALEARDRTRLGTLADGTRIPEVASFVTFYKTGTSPTQSGVGTFIRIPWTPVMTDRVALISLPFTVRDTITARPATWVEEWFWGRRNVLALTVGNTGSVAMYSLYFDQRDRVVRLGPDFSLVVATFLDADHLRLEDISPSSATRRPSRVRAGAETVLLPIATSEGPVPQTLKVQFSYFSGPVAWRPILVSLALLILGNVMGAILFAQRLGGFFSRRFRVERRVARLQPAPGLVPAPAVMATIVPGTTTLAEVLASCGPPVEERERRRSPSVRTLVYRSVERVPHARRRLGPVATVSHWDEEYRELEITVEEDRVTDVETRLRRSRVR
jgi:hypothetical protein